MATINVTPPRSGMKRRRTGTSGRSPRFRTPYTGNRLPFPRINSPRQTNPLRTGGFYGLYNGRNRVEMKFLDTNVAAQDMSSGPTINLVNGIAQGTDYNNRVGRRFLMKKIQINLEINPGVAQTVAEQGRVLVVYDNQSNGAAPAIGDILSISSTTSFMNLNNRDRFKVIWDKRYKCPVVAATNNSEFIQIDQYFRKCALEVTNSGTGATVGSIATGGLYVIGLSDGNTATQVPTISFNCRIRYQDA